MLQSETIMQFPTSINKPLTINKLPEPVTFSSNTVLNNTYDLNLSPIPFCCILEPFFTPSSDVNNNNVQQPTTIIPMMEKKDFITCTNPKCKAYLNPFCKLDLKLKRWKCVFCNQWSVSTELNENNITTPNNNNNVFQSPVKSDNEKSPPLETTSNMVDLVIPYQYIVNSSHNLATGPAALRRRTSSTTSTNNNNNNIPSIIQPKHLISRSLSTASNSSIGSNPNVSTIHPACIYVIDSNIPKSDVMHLANAITNALNQLPRDTYIGLITFGHCVKVFEVGLHGIISCDSYPGQSLLGKNELNQIELHERNPMYSGSEYMSPLHFCKENLINILKNLSGGPDMKLKRKKRRNSKRRKRGNRNGKNEATDGEANAEKNAIHVSPIKRCLPNAIRIGLEMFKVSHESLGKMIICTTGEINCGNTVNLDYLNILSNKCLLQGISIDILCVGSNYFNVPLLQNFIQTCGGNVFINRLFNEETFKLNVLEATSRNKVDDINEEEEDDNNNNNNTNTSSTIYQDISHSGIKIQVKCFDCIEIDRVIGPALTNVDDTDNTNDNDAMNQKYTFQLGTLDPLNSGIVFYFRLSEKDIPVRFGYVQFTIIFNGLDGSLRKRIITKRLLFTNSRQTFLKSINCNVAAIGIGKKAVLMAQKIKDRSKGATRSMDEICNRVYNMMAFFAQQKAKMVTVPDELKIIPITLFHLLRGPCLGPILQHGDDICCMQRLFLNSSFQTCLRITQPRLYCLKEEDILKTRHLVNHSTNDMNASSIILANEIVSKSYLQEIPMVTLALQSNFILILDHHTDIFIWSGFAVSSNGYDKIRNALKLIIQREVKHRYPSPNIMLFNENDSMARWFEARLIPAHKDNEFLQMQACQKLIGNLNNTQRKELNEKLLWTDDYSYYEWLNRVIAGTIE